MGQFKVRYIEPDTLFFLVKSNWSTQFKPVAFFFNPNPKNYVVFVSGHRVTTIIVTPLGLYSVWMHNISLNLTNYVKSLTCTKCLYNGVFLCICIIADHLS